MHQELGIEEPFSIALTCTIGGTLSDPDFTGLSVNDLMRAIVEQQKAYQKASAAKATNELKSEAKEAGKQLLQDLKENPKDALKNQQDRLKNGGEKLKKLAINSAVYLSKKQRS